MRTFMIYDASEFLDNEPPKKTVIVLSPKERHLLPLICKGYTNKAIAQLMRTSEQTVKNQIAQLMRRTQSQNRTELAIKMITHNIDIGVISETT